MDTITTYSQLADSLRLQAILTPTMSATEAFDFVFRTHPHSVLDYIVDEEMQGATSFDLETLAIVADLKAAAHD